MSTIPSKKVFKMFFVFCCIINPTEQCKTINKELIS